MKESFILFTAHYAAIKNMPQEQKGELLDALFEYAATEREPVFGNGLVEMAFKFMQTSLDKNSKKYEEKRERMKEIAARRWGKTTDNERNTCEEDGSGDAEKSEEEASENMHTHKNGCARMHTHKDSMRAHSKKCIRMLNDNDNVIIYNDNNIINKELSDDNSMSISEKSEIDGEEKGGEKKERKKETADVDYNAVMDYWNSEAARTGSVMRRITKMNPDRRGALRARLRENGGDIGAVYRAIDMAMRSRRMNGHNKDGWIANYDWMMSPKNFQRVLEGVYTEEGKATDAVAAHIEEHREEPKPRSNAEIEAELAQREAQTKADEAQREAQTKARMRAYMASARKSPNGTMARIVKAAVEDGTLARLGLLEEWMNGGE